MKLSQLKTIIKEAVKEAIQEEMKEILIEAVRTPKQVVQETVARKPLPEKDKKVFNFISLASDLEDGSTFTINNIDYVQKLGVKSDAITEWVSFNNVEGGNTYPLVVDVFESRIEPPGVQASLGIIEAVGSSNLTTVNLTLPNPNNATSLIRRTPSGVRPGMRVQLMGPNGIDAYAVGDEVVVL